MAAPTLMLITLNVEGITALLILLAEVSWRRGRSAASGMWAGMGAAFKLVPVFLLPPLIAASSWAQVFEPSRRPRQCGWRLTFPMS